jgi:hypothetical protein
VNNKSPYRLTRFVEKVIDQCSLSVSAGEKQRWLGSPVTTAIQAHLLQLLADSWARMRTSEQRVFDFENGASSIIEELLDWEVEAGNPHTPVEEATVAREAMEDFLNGRSE